MLETSHSCQSKKVKEDKKESFGSLFARNFTRLQFIFELSPSLLFG
ncbi:hypothetical protein SPAR49_0710 [Streptococcus pneumoniae GA17328]|nr:hypothetical protein SPAR49_0710 [Streptococcus pneumoniae GA17328]